MINKFNNFLLAIALCISLSGVVQASFLTRSLNKLPSAQAISKAITWKRAAFGAASVLAVGLVYNKYVKKYIKHDGQILQEFKDIALKSTHVDYTQKNFSPRFALHWPSRYKGQEEPVFEHRDVRRADGTLMVVAHKISRGLFFDWHTGWYAIDYQIPDFE